MLSHQTLQTQWHHMFGVWPLVLCLNRTGTLLMEDWPNLNQRVVIMLHFVQLGRGGKKDSIKTILTEKLISNCGTSLDWIQSSDRLSWRLLWAGREIWSTSITRSLITWRHSNDQRMRSKIGQWKYSNMVLIWWDQPWTPGKTQARYPGYGYVTVRSIL